MGTQRRTDTPVLVVGAGPVGAVLALELARHGVPSLLVERSSTPSRHPKMDYVNGRSMELLRRLGLAEQLRTGGIAPHFAADFLWSRTFDEPPVYVWHHPSVAETARRFAEVNDGSVPIEPYQRVQGSLLEELVRQAAREHPMVDMRQGLTVTGVTAGKGDGDGVVATLVDGAGRTHEVRADYLAACDGARSTVRQALDVPVDQFGPTTHHCSVYFRSGDPTLRRHGRAFVTIAARGLTLVSRDEGDTWTGSILLPDAGPLNTDPVVLMRQRLGAHFTVDEVLNVTTWEGALGVARSYRRGPAFLVGDAAHQFYPTGGHGANTGLADAVDLGWKLAACLRGWGGPALLDSYEAERRPVALFNQEMCANLMEVWRRFGRLVAAGASREHLAGFLEQEIYQLDNVGIHFGYRYSGSPVICHEDGPAPRWQWRRITPTTWPGSRPPSVRLAAGGQLFDRFGPGFTLVDFSATGLGEPMAKQADGRGVPIVHLRVDDPAAKACWERDYVLVRPDQHVAWRGDRIPDDWDAVVDRVRGVDSPERPAEIEPFG